MPYSETSSAGVSSRALAAVALLVSLAVTPGTVPAQTTIAETEIGAARAQSGALSAAERDRAQDIFAKAFDLYQAGDFASAKRDFLSGLAIDPANATANFYLAEALVRLGDRDAALARYGKTKALDPGSDMGRRAEIALAALAANRLPDDARKPLDSFKDCDQCPEMVVIPSGSFMMGTEQGEPGHFVNELPKRKVTLARNFAVGKFAVTFAEWDACKADDGCNGYSPPDNNWGRGRQPVIFVSWNNAKDYVAWLSKKTGKTYRLLSEAEREYVTRAGTVTPFWWGAQISPELANYDGKFSFESGPKGRFRGRPLPVDSFKPNPWGLFQMHGNVLEWLEDCATDATWKSYADAPTDGSAQTASDCKAHMLRGGAWDDLPRGLRSATRTNAFHTSRNYAYGFRVARDLDR